jgi:glycine hydroxymethyltransferase
MKEGIRLAFIPNDDAGRFAEGRAPSRTLSLIAPRTPPRSVLEAMGWPSATRPEDIPPALHTGCQVLDELEMLAIQRAKALFGAEHANVQPHSGVNANLAVYGATLKPGGALLSMKLSHGGHLSHGDAASLTGRIYQSFHYSVNPDTERLDYDQIRDLAKTHRPAVLVAGASSYPRLIDYAALRSITDEV